MNKEILEVQETPKESTNPFDVAEQTKQDQLLAEEIIQSGLLYTKKGREALGIKLTPYKKDTQKIGRNNSCLCGSGKKYKKCCL